MARFGVRSGFAPRSGVQVVGRETEPRELWIPTGDLEGMRANLVGSRSQARGPAAGTQALLLYRR